MQVTDEFLEFISDGSLAIEVWGHSCAGSGNSPWELDALEAKIQTLRDRCVQHQARSADSLRHQLCLNLESAGLHAHYLSDSSQHKIFFVDFKLSLSYPNRDSVERSTASTRYCWPTVPVLLNTSHILIRGAQTMMVVSKNIKIIENFNPYI